MGSRGTVKRASMVPPRDIQARVGCERNAEDAFLSGEIVRPREPIPGLHTHNVSDVHFKATLKRATRAKKAEFLAFTLRGYRI
jgi:hypothetical protein